MINLFAPNTDNIAQEQFDPLLQTPDIHIEKITSNGQASSEWYKQEREEWVVLMESEGGLCFEDGSEVRLLKGEHLFIPKMQKHKVVYTSSPALCLAIHFKSEQ